MERFGVNASKSRSEVTPNEWFETYGSKPEIREPPKRRHFAAITKATETCPFQPCEASIYQQQKTQDSKGFRLKPFGPVCVATQGFDLKAGVAAVHDLDLKANLRGARF